MAKAIKKQIENGMTLIPADYQPIVISALKRSFSRGPVVREFLRKRRREEDWYKKDGSKAKKKHVFYTCAQCNKEFNSTQVQVDHIIPVVPVNIPAKHMSIGDLIHRLYVQEDGLQILCKKDHKEKSSQENALRKEWISKVKYIVYQTNNRSNHRSYIGIHKCEDYEDGYIGSGTALKAAITKYGSKNFYRSVLFAYETPEEAYSKERELVNKEWIDSDNNYNIALGGVYNEKESPSLGKKIICHQTGEVFKSINELSKKLDISASSISKVLNNANAPLRNLHYFTTNLYDPSVETTHPVSESLRKIVLLNTRTTYDSISIAAHSLGINYKSLRNSLLVKNIDGLYHIDGYYFLYEYEYDSDQVYVSTKIKIKCKELNRVFNTCTEAASFIKHKKPNFGGIAIGRAARTGKKMFKYNWEYIAEETKF